MRLWVLAGLATVGLGCFAVVPGCGAARDARRSVTAPVIDEATGTVYALEVDDAVGRFSSDQTVVVICNEELSRVCYRVRPVDALDAEDLAALQTALRELRRRRAAATE